MLDYGLQKGIVLELVGKTSIEGVSGLTVDALILALVIDVMEAPQHLDSGKMRASIIDNAL